MSAILEMDNRLSSADLIAKDLMRRRTCCAADFRRCRSGPSRRGGTRHRLVALQARSTRENLAELAVEDTGLGNVPDKIIKKQRKTFGTLRDLLRAKTVGEIERDDKRGIVKFAKPIGVVGAITPSTNPGATPVNKTMMAIKGRNAVIIAPSPLGYRTTALAVEYMRESLEQIGLPKDLVQILPSPVTKDTTQAIMEAVDLVVVTGSQDNVRRAYHSGTPAIGVGAGNVPVIIDETADLTSAAQKICASKTFDNATSCSSENAVVIVESVYDAAIEALKKAGGYLVDGTQKERVQSELWQEWKAEPASDRSRYAGARGKHSDCRTKPRTRNTYWWKKLESEKHIRCRAKSWRWFSRSTRLPTLKPQPRRCARFLIIRGKATRWACTPPTWQGRSNLPKTCRSCVF